MAVLQAGNLSGYISENSLLNVPKLADGADLPGSEAFAFFAGQQIEIFVVGCGLSVLDQIQCAQDRVIAARQYAMLGPDQDFMSPQDPHSFSHLWFRSGHDERQNAKTFGEIDNGLWLPPKKMIVQIAPVLITLDMAQVCKMKRLTMKHGMQLDISPGHLVDMHCQVRIKLAGYALIKFWCGHSMV